MQPSEFPYIGQVVIYHHPGSGDLKFSPTISPAIVTAIGNYTDMMEVDLLIFSNFNGILFQKRVKYGELRRNWSYNQADENAMVEEMQKLTKRNIGQDSYPENSQTIPGCDIPCDVDDECDEPESFDYLKERAARGARVIKNSVEKQFQNLEGKVKMSEKPCGCTDDTIWTACKLHGFRPVPTEQIGILGQTKPSKPYRECKCHN